MTKQLIYFSGIIFLLAACGHQDALVAPISKTTELAAKPLDATTQTSTKIIKKPAETLMNPITDAADEVLKERKVGEDGGTQAVIFSRDEDDQAEGKQFKLSF